MQDNQFSLKLTDEDKRWLTYPGLASSTTTDAGGITEAPAQISLALASASLENNSLSVEQVRLRETLEALNTTLSTLSDSRLTTAGAASNDSWVGKGLEAGVAVGNFLGKELMSSLWDKAKDRLSGKALDAVAEEYPRAAKWLKEDKDKDASSNAGCCIRDFSAGSTGGRKNPQRGKSRKGQKSAGKAKRSGSGKKRSAPGAWLREATDRVGKVMFSDSQSSFQAVASAPRGSPSVSGSRLAGVMSRLESVGARRVGPLRYVDSAFEVIQGVRNGDANAVGAGLSTNGGAWAGASAGAAIGTMILPGVGTAVGGVIGGLLGGEVGTWFGDKFFAPSDRLSSPDAVSKELNSARTDNVQVSIAPSIQITGVNPADAQQVVNQVIQALQFQCMPMVTDSLGIRRNAALADPGGD